MSRTIACAVLTALLFAAECRAVVFATTRVNTTVTQTTGTRTELVQLIEPVLVSAGWTTISGTGTGDVVMQSSDPSGAIPAIRVRIYDSGSGNCARVSFRNVAGTQISNDLFLLAAASKTWRIIANEFQFFVFNTAASTTPRNFVAGGIPAVPSFLSPSVVWWGMGDAISDTDTTFRGTFRVRLGAHRNGYGPTTTNSGMHACNYNGVLMDGNTTTTPSSGVLRVVAPYDVNPAENNVFNVFADDSWMVSDSWIGWGTSGSVTGSAFRLVGTIYDAIVVSGNISPDTTITFNGNNFYVVTVGAAPSSTQGNPSVLALRIP